MKQILTQAKKALSNVFSKAQKEAAINTEIRKRYSTDVSLGYTLSGGTGNAAQSVGSFLKSKNLPGQKIANAFATQREKSPQYQTNKKLATGQPITPRQMNQTIEAGMTPVIGMASPVKKVTPKLPKIDFRTQQEMIEFIDYTRLRAPENLPIELGATRIAEKYGLKMPKTTAGLANEFDRVLTLFRNRK